ncbi:MFS transporter [Streptomyces beigongshangae]|uniref:MFS transporter n=1 Tax=Streptomyces beigongshangae TaxID=2841597 RepID=UPI001C84E240|nr:MFS transporter [Streptomyces sp. REN17]
MSEEAVAQRPAVPRTAWVRLAVCTAIAALLQADGTIIAVALPSVGTAFGVSAPTASWLLTAYFATYAIALFPGGRLVDGFGYRRIALAGLTVFCAGTLLGALADSFGLLTASRVVQGAGAGLASPAAFVGAVSGFPAERRGTALGLWGASSGLSNLVGPLLGGVLTEAWGWRANWWALLPLTLLTAGAVLRWVPRSGAAAPDVPATRPSGPPGRPATATATATVRAAALVAALTFAVMIGTFFAVEQYLQHAAGYGVLEAATAPLVVALCIGAVGAAGGRLVDRVGDRMPALVGFLACAVAFAVYALPVPPLHGPALLPGGLLLGAGLGLLFPSTSRAALNATPRSLHGRASAQLSFGRLAGAAVGAALAGLAFRDGVTAGHLHAALAGGAVLSLGGALVVALRFPDAPEGNRSGH